MNGTPRRSNDAYEEIERYLEKAQEEIGKAFYDLQYSEENEFGSLSRPPSGDVHLLVAWVENFARVVHQSLPDDEEIELPPPYENCKYGTECPLLKPRRPHSVAVQQKARRLSCPTCRSNSNRRTYTRQVSDTWLINERLTREIGIQTQWTDVCHNLWKVTSPNFTPVKADETSLIENFYLQHNGNHLETCENVSRLDSPNESHNDSLINILSFKSLDVDEPIAEIVTIEDSLYTKNGRCRSAENISNHEVPHVQSNEQYSASLPKELTRKPPIREHVLDHSASSSTVSSQVSRTELRDFMKKVESSTYRPPTPANKEVETEKVEDVTDNPTNQRDAVTQTTPHPSRSSSFTMVTECDCSDLETVSEHSLLSFSCSTTTSSDIGGQDTSSTSSYSSAIISHDLSSSSSSLSLSSATSLKSDFSIDVISEEYEQNIVPPKVDCEIIWEKRDCNKLPQCPVPLATDAGDVTPDSGVETAVLTPDLIVKSSSVPALQRHLSSSGESTPRNLEADDSVFIASGRHPKQFIELQTLEACMWLRAAGFPQYAQMYEENQFPIDLRIVQADHSFLDEDSLQSLYRRLDTLNRCVKMKAIDSVTRHALPDDDTDEEELCALSDSWQFERSNRRWSRVPSSISTLDNSIVEKFITKKYSSSYSSDSVFGDDQHQSSPDSTRKPVPESKQVSTAVEETVSVSGSSSGGSPCLIADLGDKQNLKKGLRRSGSDRIKEGAKALLRRMDSLKGKKKKKSNQEKTEAQDIIMVTTADNVDTSPNCSTNSSPKITHQQASPTSTTTEDSSAGGDTSEESQGSTPKMKHRKKVWRILGFSNSKSNSCTDVDQSVILFPDQWRDTNFNNTKLIENCLQSKKYKHLNRDIIYTNNNELFSIRDDWIHHSQKQKKLSDGIITPVLLFNRTCSLDTEEQKIYSPLFIYSADDMSSRLTNSDPELSECTDVSTNRRRRDSGVGLSLNRPALSSSNIQSRWHCFPHDPYWNSTTKPSTNEMINVDALTAPQLVVLRKFSLLKMTMLMEKYTPSSRTGWSWAVPKFIRKIRTPDYKDKAVFGVPLLVIVQRTGYPLPASIQEAIQYLENNSLDTVGIFRKSGVKSRIQKLRNQNESNVSKISYDDQQAYDVADMLKQYFRELPEALLTNKLSETFISIFQYVPESQRLEALQAAVLLMPDENREVLHTLLAFLNKVYQHAGENQMTATNLAVCFAPSLFHLTTPRSASASPRRRKTIVVLDQKELNENRAAYECLTKMILDYKQLFTVSGDMLSHHYMSYLEHCHPATLEEFGKIASKTKSGWKIYIEGCINNLLKETKEKYKGWVPITQNDGADITYKKVGDNYPLRLWKVVVEIEAPPAEVLNRILRERHIWDDSLIKWRVVSKLEKNSEIFQYVCSSLTPHLPRDYCILRSWQTDLPKGTCVLIEMSVNHFNTPLLTSCIQGMVLASRYLIEPCGSGKSRITHISRIDMCGHSSEWYNKIYGSILATKMSHLRDSFCLGSEGPETKV